jgi:hypothetical protein
MATKYFRITGYHPEENFSFIMDSNGKFEMLWQFSSYLVKKGLKILEVSTDEQFKDINITRAPENTTQMMLRANAKGKPIYSEKIINGIPQKVVTVGDKSYMPTAN